MSFPDPPLSRRAVMRAAGIAPVILLGKQAWADPTNEAARKLALVTRSVPANELQAILNAAVVTYKPVDRDALELVARAMWAHFTFGAGQVEAPGIMLHAYNFAGGHVVNSLKNDKFDPFGNDYLTNFCCYVCGHKAATIATQGINAPLCGPAIPAPTPTDSVQITPTIYECAWKLTQKEMEQKLTLAGPSTGLGNGC